MKTAAMVMVVGMCCLLVWVGHDAPKDPMGLNASTQVGIMCVYIYYIYIYIYICIGKDIYGADAMEAPK